MRPSARQRIWASSPRQNDPRHAEIVLQTLEICGLKISPSVQRRHFAEPARSQARDAGGHAAVFLVVSESATLGQCAKSVSSPRRAASRSGDRGRTTHPQECSTNPCETLAAMDWSVRSTAIRDAGTRGTSGVCAVEHAALSGNEKQEPAIQMPIQDVASKESADRAGKTEDKARCK